VAQYRSLRTSLCASIIGTTTMLPDERKNSLCASKEMNTETDTEGMGDSRLPIPVHCNRFLCHTGVAKHQSPSPVGPSRKRQCHGSRHTAHQAGGVGGGIDGPRQLTSTNCEMEGIIARKRLASRGGRGGRRGKCRMGRGWRGWTGPREEGIGGWRCASRGKGGCRHSASCTSDPRPTPHHRCHHHSSTFVSEWAAPAAPRAAHLVGIHSRL